MARRPWFVLSIGRAPHGHPLPFHFPMPDPSSDSLNEGLNTAKQVLPENVGALTRDQLTPAAAAAPQALMRPGTSVP